MADDASRFGGGTPAHEAMLEQKRAALRRVLKREYLLRAEKPFPGGKAEPGAIFDAAVQRWQAARATHHMFYYPTAKNLATNFVCLALPIGLITYFYIQDKMNWEYRCRRGEIAYDARERQRKYALNY